MMEISCLVEPRGRGDTYPGFPPVSWDKPGKRTQLVIDAEMSLLNAKFVNHCCKKLYSEKINKRGRDWPIFKKKLMTFRQDDICFSWFPSYGYFGLLLSQNAVGPYKLPVPWDSPHWSGCQQVQRSSSHALPGSVHHEWFGAHSLAYKPLLWGPPEKVILYPLTVSIIFSINLWPNAHSRWIILY